MLSEIMENFPVELARCVKILLNIEACKFWLLIGFLLVDRRLLPAYILQWLLLFRDWKIYD